MSDTGYMFFFIALCAMQEMTGLESDILTSFASGYLCEVPDAEINSRTASDSFGQTRKNLKGLGCMCDL